MASPLPNTKAPAFVKNHKICASPVAVAAAAAGGTAIPVSGTSAGSVRPDPAHESRRRGGACSSSTTTPHRMNKLPTSVSLHAVTAAISPATAQSRRSRPIVRRISFQADRTMIPMTAAPTP